MSDGALHTVAIGDLATRAGAVIRDCQVSYRCLGQANADASNIVLWPTCFTEQSASLIETIETLRIGDQHQVILVDALGNGVSSSPSNCANFPSLCIHDMVRSQHALLTQHLGVMQVQAVCGISMGGMQALEWMVSHPDFMDQVVCMAGTPRQSTYDLLLWNTQLRLIRAALARGDAAGLEFTRQRLIDLDQLHLHTPAYLARTLAPEMLQDHLETLYRDRLELPNLAAQIEAMVAHDIFRSANLTEPELRHRVKAQLLLIATTQDLMVNPINSLALAQQLDCEIMEIDSDCGHDLLADAAAEIGARLGAFLSPGQSRGLATAQRVRP